MVAAEVTEKEGSLALPILPAFTTDCGGEPVHQDAYAARIMPGSISEFVPQLSAFIIKVWLVPVQPLADTCSSACCPTVTLQGHYISPLQATPGYLYPTFQCGSSIPRLSRYKGFRATLRSQETLPTLTRSACLRREREREREIQPYVHSANVAYEDKSLFMSQPIEGWLSGNQKHPPGPCAT